MFSRREFILGATTTAATSIMAQGCATTGRVVKGSLDPNRVVIASDIHIPLPWSEQKYRTGQEYPWIIDTVKAHIAEILTLDPLPANVITLGDISIAFGEEREYEIFRELMKPLEDAGITVTHAMGNHDIRASYAKCFPEAAAKSLVPGRYFHKVVTPYADFIVLDSLKEPDVRGKYDALTSCGLGKEQADWLIAELRKIEKPTFVCAHHTLQSLEVKKQVIRTPKVVGYLHGHHHHWMQDAIFHGYASDSRTLQSVGIGAFAIDRDIGYAVMDMKPVGASLKMVAKDYYFPVKLPRSERPKVWDAIVHDNQGRKIHFPF